MQDKNQELEDYVAQDDVNTEEKDDLSESVFACCHLYRECSAQKRCLCDDETRALQCAYRKNLEARNIFYGRNAKGFDESQYQDFVSRIDTLSKDGQKAFEKLITEFCGLHRGKDQLVVRNEYIDELAQVGLFKFEKLGPYIVQKSLYSSLEKKLDGLGDDVADLYGKAKKAYKSSDKGGAGARNFFSTWLNGPGVKFRDELAEPYRLATAKADVSLFIEELWQRRYLPAWRHRDWWLTPLAVDGLLPLTSLKAEINRIVPIIKKDCSDSEQKEISDLLKAGNVVSKRANFM